MNKSEQQVISTIPVALNENSSVEIPLGRDQYLSILALVGKSIIYYNIDDNGACLYYKYDFSKGKTYYLGAISNFLITTDSSAILADNIYFYATTGKAEENHNVLYKIDLQNNLLSEVASESLYHTLVYTKSTGDHMIALKGKLNGDLGKTYIEKINPNNKENELFAEKIINVKSGEGEVLKNIAFSQEKIYAISEKSSSNTVVSSLIVYDSSGNVIRNISLKDLDEVLNGQLIDELKVMEDYIFIRNFSGYAVICKIAGDEARTVFRSEDGLDVASDSVEPAAEVYIFFRRGSREVYILDPKQNELRTIHLNLHPEFTTVRNIVTDGSYNMIIFLSKDEQYKIFYLNAFNELSGSSVQKLSPDHAITVGN